MDYVVCTYGEGIVTSAENADFTGHVTHDVTH